MESPEATQNETYGITGRNQNSTQVGVAGPSTNQKPHHKGVDALRAHPANLQDAVGFCLFKTNLFVTKNPRNAWLKKICCHLRPLNSCLLNEIIWKIPNHKGDMAKRWCIPPMSSSNIPSGQWTASEPVLTVTYSIVNSTRTLRVSGAHPVRRDTPALPARHVPVPTLLRCKYRKYIVRWMQGAIVFPVLREWASAIVNLSVIRCGAREGRWVVELLVDRLAEWGGVVFVWQETLGRGPLQYVWDPNVEMSKTLLMSVYTGSSYRSAEWNHQTISVKSGWHTAHFVFTPGMHRWNVLTFCSFYRLQCHSGFWTQRPKKRDLMSITKSLLLPSHNSQCRAKLITFPESNFLTLLNIFRTLFSKVQWLFSQLLTLWPNSMITDS